MLVNMLKDGNQQRVQTQLHKPEEAVLYSSISQSVKRINHRWLNWKLLSLRLQTQLLEREWEVWHNQESVRWVLPTEMSASVDASHKLNTKHQSDLVQKPQEESMLEYMLKDGNQQRVQTQLLKLEEVEPYTLISQSDKNINHH